MADFFIRNPLKPTQVYTISITMRQIIMPSQDPSLAGELVWVLEGATLAMDCEGITIPAERIFVRNYNTIDEEINNLVNKISSKMCWELIDDTQPPYILEKYPLDNEADIPVTTSISVRLSDGLEKEFAASGIKKNSIKFYMKGFDMTEQLEIVGNPWDYSFNFTPGTKGT